MTTTPPSQTATYHLFDFFTIPLFQFTRLTIGAIIVSAALSYGAFKLTPTVYKSSASLIYRLPSLPITFSDEDPPVYSTRFENELANQKITLILNSRHAQEKIVAGLHREFPNEMGQYASDDWLGLHYKFYPHPDKKNLFHLSYQHPDARIAQATIRLSIEALREVNDALFLIPDKEFFQILDPPSRPDRPFSPRRSIHLPLFFGIFMLFYFSFFSISRYIRDQIRQGHGQ